MNINVSDIRTYLVCPRILYFRGDDEWKDKADKFLKHTFLREISLEEALYEREWEDKSILNKLLLRSFSSVEGKIEDIYREEFERIDSSLFSSVKEEVKNELSEISEGIWCAVENSGGEVRALMEPEEIERRLYSDRLGLFGRVDKIISDREKDHIPSIIKTGRCPDFGVWKEDRIQLAAYVMLLEEEVGKTINRGVVEYFRFGKPILVEINRYDRRLVLDVRNKIKKIYRGNLPEREEKVFCKYCEYREECAVKRSLFSKFF
ncbi:MAG: CRISPR-associated protein Cas4 [Candidatus Methanolliviera hydrocarbonicum]|jgi:CRISPR-associated protein Cas4|uniref:CRISPR-associated exonuclease Cas4 n=1 Tax=Candidatus Methanolliviera hydrocarbonicum TaxID=2491085 RepID=A0A520KUX6_9EURY|nr:MAG: CRISPR-associated protein Cas4 [Candidatus Methanolliviera hydrocarbonicum]